MKRILFNYLLRNALPDSTVPDVLAYSARPISLLPIPSLTLSLRAAISIPDHRPLSSLDGLTHSTIHRTTLFLGFRFGDAPFSAVDGSSYICFAMPLASDWDEKAA